MISVLIPYRPDNGIRDRIFDWTLRYWRSLLPTTQFSLAGYTGEPFNRAAARNEAFAQSTGDLLVIVDADTVIPRRQFFDALELVESRQVPWMIPYTVYYNLREEESELLMDDGSGPMQEPTVWEHRLTDSVAGVLIVPRAAFEAVNGYDERFVGWGGEDRAFAMALDTLWGPHTRSEGYVQHLWHPRGDADFTQPEWHRNALLLRQYQGAQNPLLMQRLVKQ
jgi:glycosyltransferase involved in cell wall biosynthesis